MAHWLTIQLRVARSFFPSAIWFTLGLHPVGSDLVLSDVCTTICKWPSMSFQSPKIRLQEIGFLQMGYFLSHTLNFSNHVFILLQLTAHLSNFAQNCQELQSPRWQVDPKKREAASVGRTSYSVRRTGQSAGFQAATNADEQIKKGWPLAAIVLKHLEFGISKCVWLSWDTSECFGLA